jgi:hypothetical protein
VPGSWGDGYALDSDKPEIPIRGTPHLQAQLPSELRPIAVKVIGYAQGSGTCAISELWSPVTAARTGSLSWKKRSPRREQARLV